jgi:hypothetical protein
MKTINVTRIKILADAPTSRSVVAIKHREGTKWYNGVIQFADDSEIKRLTKKQLLTSPGAITYLGDINEKSEEQLNKEAEACKTARDVFAQFVTDEKLLDEYMESTIQMELTDEEFEAFNVRYFKDADEVIYL